MGHRGRYLLLERLGAGGMGEVFRARDRLGGEVALKRVRARAQQGRSEPGQAIDDATWTHSDYPEVRAGQSAPGRAVSVGRDETLTLVREFQTLSALRHPHVIEVLDYGVDAATGPFFTMSLLAAPAPITSVPPALRITSLLQLLDALRYLHRRGVLHRDVKPSNVLVASGQVKVVDFGLAHRAGQGDPIGWGTRPYMAPELLAGAPPTPASDLFAVGVIAFELLTGRHPWGRGEFQPPPLEALPAPHRALIGRLLDPDWRARPDDAGAVRAELAETAGPSVAALSDATRRVWFKRAPFVGRRTELQLLSGALAALPEGQGSGWLVRGPSGAGKSRLLDELRTRALVAGALVLEGTGALDDPGRALRGVLHRLAVEVEITDAEAGPLDAWIPDLSGLLEHPVPAPAPLEADAAHERLVAVVQALLVRVQRPVVLLLEDLQWAGSNVLRLINQLAVLTRSRGLMIVATARDTAPEVADAVDALRPLPLGWLSPEDTDALLTHLIDDPRARSPELLARIREDGEGSPLFLVELSRQLVEDPERALLGELAPGLRELLRARIARVPPTDRPTLELAAVLGRAVEPGILQRLDPGVDVAAFLSAGIEASVLELRDGQARFAHDRLREELLSWLSPDRLAELHRRAAEALGASHGAERLAPRLAHHLERAGARPQAARWAAVAGAQALAVSAYREAIAFFERALALEEPSAREEAARRERARTAGLLAECLLRHGDYGQAAARASEALSLLGQAVPRGRAALGLRIASDVVQTLRNLDRPLPPPAPLDPTLLLVDRALNTLSESSFHLDRWPVMLWSSLRLYVHGEARGATAELARGYAGLALVAGTARLHPVARRAASRSVALAEAQPPAVRAQVLQRASAYRVSICEWERSHADLERSRALATEVGDRRQWQESTAVLALHHVYRGHFSEGKSLALAVAASARAHRDRQAAFWGAPIAAFAALRRGELDEAAALLEEALAQIEAQTSAPDRVNVHGPLALLHLRRDDRAQALAHAKGALALMRGQAINTYWIHQGLDAACEALLALWATEEDAAARRAIGAQARTSVQLARRLGRVFPVARASARIWSACAKQIEGHRAAAVRELERARGEAQARGLSYEEARAELEACLATNGPLAIEDASRRLEALGAADDVARAQGWRASRPGPAPGGP